MIKSVICISGKARHGKDTVATMMKVRLNCKGYSVLVIHYADLLKWICEKYFDWDGQKDEAGRYLLQHVGTDVVRKRSPDFWCDFVVRFVCLFKEEWDYIIIPDCRFPNEVDCWKKAGVNAVHVRVNRPDFDNGLSEEAKNHPSETSLDNVSPDIEIINDDDINKNRLRQKSIDFVEALTEHCGYRIGRSENNE